MAVDEMPNDKKTYDINSCAVSMPTAHDGRGAVLESKIEPVPQLLTGDYVYWIVYLAYIWQVFVRKVSKNMPPKWLFSKGMCHI